MTYLWKCTHCGHEERVERPMSKHDEKPSKWCCFKTNWERVFEAPMIVTGDGVKV